jgi:hypothetical protein
MSDCMCGGGRRKRRHRTTKRKRSTKRKVNRAGLHAPRKKYKRSSISSISNVKSRQNKFMSDIEKEHKNMNYQKYFDLEKKRRNLEIQIEASKRRRRNKKSRQTKKRKSRSNSSSDRRFFVNQLVKASGYNSS